MTITKKEIIETIKAAGLMKKCICLHSSLKSFGEVRGGANTVVEAFVETGCTMLVPTFSYYKYAVMPAEALKYERNGANYNDLRWITPGNKEIYSSQSNELDLKDMGRIPETVLNKKGRVRGSHPLCSFTAIGPFAAELIKTQSPMDVYAPLRELALFNGAIVLMGVGLTKMTAIHLAEQMAGRNMFVRWAKAGDGSVMPAECGGDSDGFEKLAPFVSAAEKKVKCGDSLWRVFDAGKMLKGAARGIIMNPEITYCGKKDCLRCKDMVKGGAIVKNS